MYVGLFAQKRIVTVIVIVDTVTTIQRGRLNHLITK